MIEFLKFGASWVLPPGIFFVLFLFIAYCCKKKKTNKTSNSYYICYIYFLFSINFLCSKYVNW